MIVISFGHEARDHPDRAMEVLNDHLDGAPIGQPRGEGGLP
jgi:hypothetical protein